MAAMVGVMPGGMVAGGAAGMHGGVVGGSGAMYGGGAMYSGGAMVGGGAVGGGGVGGGGACGGAACGCEAAAGPPVMSYVGAGGGDYIQETTYKYIGRGAGEFEVVATKKANNTCLLIGGAVGVLVLLIVVVLLLLPGPISTTTSPTLPDESCMFEQALTEAMKADCCRTKGMYCATTEAPTTALPFDCTTTEVWPPAKKTWCCENTQQPPGACGGTPPAPPSTCQLWGDPHINTFDKGHADFYGEGIKYLVKSAEVSIQARYKATPFTNGLAATNAVAIGGSFMQGHVLKVGPMENGQITFDNQAILTSFGTYSAAGLGTVTYDDKGELVDGAMGHLERHIVHMALPGGVTVEVMRWSNHINLRITMAPRAGQDGHCGNFNGNPADDTTDAIRARVGMGVPQGESLFRTWQAPVPGKRETLSDCPPQKKAQAEQACRQAGRTDLETCTFDACFAGTQYVSEGM